MSKIINIISVEVKITGGEIYIPLRKREGLEDV